jgi:hypothetical protein
LNQKNLELFDPIAQEYDWDEFLQQSPHTTSENQNYKVRQADALVKHRLPCPAEETRRAEQPHLRATRTEGQINQHKWWNPEPVQDHRNQYRHHSTARRRTERTP